MGYYCEKFAIKIQQIRIDFKISVIFLKKFSPDNDNRDLLKKILQFILDYNTILFGI